MDWITPQLILEAVVLPFIGYLAKQITRYNRERREQEQEISGLLHLLVKAEITNSRTNITQEISRFCEQGHASRNDRYNVDQLVRIYHKLGGNGTIDDYLALLRKLPDTEMVVKEARVNAEGK